MSGIIIRGPFFCKRFCKDFPVQHSQSAAQKTVDSAQEIFPHSENPAFRHSQPADAAPVPAASAAGRAAPPLPRAGRWYRRKLLFPAPWGGSQPPRHRRRSRLPAQSPSPRGGRPPGRSSGQRPHRPGNGGGSPASWPGLAGRSHGP